MILDARPADDEGIDGWRVCRIRCRFCGHEAVSVFPAEADEMTLECSKCGICEGEVLIEYPPEEAIADNLYSGPNRGR